MSGFQMFDDSKPKCDICYRVNDQDFWICSSCQCPEGDCTEEKLDLEYLEFLESLSGSCLTQYHPIGRWCLERKCLELFPEYSDHGPGLSLSLFAIWASKQPEWKQVEEFFYENYCDHFWEEPTFYEAFPTCSPKIIFDWLLAKVPADEIGDWPEYFGPQEASEWLDRGESLEAALEWAETEWAKTGRSVAEADAWLERRFSLKAAADWVQMGCSIAEAMVFRENGFSVGDGGLSSFEYWWRLRLPVDLMIEIRDSIERTGFLEITSPTGIHSWADYWIELRATVTTLRAWNLQLNYENIIGYWGLGEEEVEKLLQTSTAGALKYINLPITPSNLIKYRNLEPEQILAIIDSGIDSVQAIELLREGVAFKDLSVAMKLRDLDADVEMCRKFLELGISSKHLKIFERDTALFKRVLLLARSSIKMIDFDDLVEWGNLNLGHAEVEQWIGLECDAETARSWILQEFDAHEASLWITKAAVSDPVIAARRRSAGITP
jgi:hypothetical protein